MKFEKSTGKLCHIANRYLILSAQFKPICRTLSPYTTKTSTSMLLVPVKLQRLVTEHE